MQRVRGTTLYFLLIALLCFSCGDEDGDGSGAFSLSQTGDIELDPSTRDVKVSIGEIAVGASIPYKIRIRNVGDGALTIFNLALAYEAPGDGDTEGPAFTLSHSDSLPIKLAPSSATTGLSETFVTVQFTRQDTFANRTAILTIDSDDRQQSDQSIKVRFTEKEALATINVSPSVIDFETVPLKTKKCEQVNVTNTGSDTLIVSRFMLDAHPDFCVQFDDEEHCMSEESLQGVELETPLEIAPDSTRVISICFGPQTPDPASGELVIISNDPTAEKGKTIILLANQNVPCIDVKPPKVDFGGKIVGQKDFMPVEVCSCGDAPLRLKGIGLVDGETSPDFSVMLDNIPGVDPVTGIDPEVPVVVDVNECIQFLVQCTPDIVNPIGADNKPEPDTGTVRIESNAFEAEIDVPLSCIGIEVDCPIAVASVEEGDQVIPQTTLHLQGDQSYSPQGFEITSYSWQVEQPEGSNSAFVPNSVFSNPVLDANAAGVYSFQLSVTDEAGTESCEPAKVDVLVIPDEAIHVELLWTTECDKNKTDIGEGQGTDMDLHFAHPFAAGSDIDGDGEPDPWFDQTFDCFYFNKEPNWGTFDPQVEDDPSLDLDDIDGWGPENLNINIPEVGATYDVGVHYWNDFGYGPSLATVRVYIYGELDLEIKDVELKGLDMWHAAQIPWEAEFSKTKAVTKDDGTYHIAPKYQNPFFISPCNCNGTITQSCIDTEPPDSNPDDSGTEDGDGKKGDDEDPAGDPPKPPDGE